VLVNVVHCPEVNASFGPSGFFESRTATTPAAPVPTSTQEPPLLL
jgi:hypothetical protein